MIPRIKSIKPDSDYMLRVIFDDGKMVMYDVKEDIKDIPNFAVLKSVTGLFKQVQLDSSRTCVFWNEDIDLASDTIYEYCRAENELVQDLVDDMQNDTKTHHISTIMRDLSRLKESRGLI